MDWELNYADRETLRQQLASRCTEAVRKFLLYVQGGGGNMSQERKDWCTSKLPEAQSLGSQMTNYMVSEPAFIAGGTSITDAAIQSRVESVLTTYFMPA